jgi:diguanylate cyclase (GGDEF)-like protein
MIPAISVLRKTFSSSFKLKVTAICLAVTHIPLLVLVLSQTGGPASLAAISSATPFATAFGVYAVCRLIRPLNQIAATIDTYRDSGVVVPVTCDQPDGIGSVVNGVSTLIVELDASLVQLRRQATTDALTGLGNRRWLNELGSMEIARAIRTEAPLSLMIFDLDHFKAINDEFGHDVGDQVLMMTGMVIQDTLRPYDIAARVGGEEFCILLPSTEIGHAAAIAERLRRQLASRTVGPVPAGRVTASFGVYQGSPGTEALKTMLAEADQRLYAGKNAGRNMVYWTTPGTPLPEEIGQRKTTAPD